MSTHHGARRGVVVLDEAEAQQAEGADRAVTAQARKESGLKKRLRTLNKRGAQTAKHFVSRARNAAADYNAATAETQQACRQDYDVLLHNYPGIAKDNTNNNKGDGDNSDGNSENNSRSDGENISASLKHLEIEQGELAGEEGAPKRTRTDVAEMLKSLARRPQLVAPPTPVDNNTQDQQKTLAMLRKVQQQLSALDRHMKEMNERIRSLEALQTTTEDKKQLITSLTRAIRKKLRTDSAAGIKNILWLERINNSDESATWWKWLDKEEWTGAQKDAVDGTVVKIMREQVRKERSVLAEKVRLQISCHVSRAYGVQLPPFPRAGTVEKEDTKQMVIAWCAALEAVEVPQPGQLRNYLELIADVAVALFDTEQKPPSLAQLTFCIWLYHYWYAGKLLAQVSSETPYKTYNDMLRKFEAEPDAHKTLTDALDDALGRRMRDGMDKEEADVEERDDEHHDDDQREDERDEDVDVDAGDEEVAPTSNKRGKSTAGTGGRKRTRSSK
jgi:hypothetical protein